MKLTTARLLDLAELSDAALRVYLTAHARIEETTAQGLTAAGLMNLPGMPRNPKALARTIQELAEHGLVVGAETGRYLFASLTSDVSSKRAEAGRLGGLAKASKRLASASDLPGSNVVAMPADCHASTQDPRSLSSDLISSLSESSSLLSSSQGPVSKPARKARKTAYPDDFDAAIRPRVFEWAKGQKYPDWWVDDRLAQMKLQCGAKGVVNVDWYLAAIGWLRREDKDYGNGPDALDAKRARSAGPPPGFQQHQQHLVESARRPESRLLRPVEVQGETVGAADFERVLRGRP
jgi:hypothetical protein